ncbi:MAG: hypothetical protein AAFR02_00015 [Pseudomonadota bacterium]
MSKITHRHLSARLRLPAGDTDWLNLDRSTSEAGNTGTTSKDITKREEPKQLSAAGNQKRWLNGTNLTELKVVKELMSPASNLMLSVVQPDHVERAIRLGLSVLQGAEEVVSAREVSALALAIPFLPMRDIDFVYRDPAAVELVWDGHPSECVYEFLRSVTLPKQVLVVRKRFQDTLIFAALREVAVIDLLIEHGWQTFEPPYELILQREARGAVFSRNETWLKAP